MQSKKRKRESPIKEEKLPGVCDFPELDDESTDPLDQKEKLQLIATLENTRSLIKDVAFPHQDEVFDHMKRLNRISEIPAEDWARLLELLKSYEASRQNVALQKKEIREWSGAEKKTNRNVESIISMYLGDFIEPDEDLLRRIQARVNLTIRVVLNLLRSFSCDGHEEFIEFLDADFLGSEDYEQTMAKEMLNILKAYVQLNEILSILLTGRPTGFLFYNLIDQVRRYRSMVNEMAQFYVYDTIEEAIADPEWPEFGVNHPLGRYATE